MGIFAGINQTLGQELANRRQDAVIDRSRHLDDLERSIQVYQAGGGTNPDGTAMSPEQRQQAIQAAVTQRIKLSTPEEGPQLFQKLRDLFHPGSKQADLPTATRQPWDEKIPGVTTNPQTGAPSAPKGAGQPQPVEPMSESLGMPQKPSLVHMAQQGPMSLEQIISSATPPQSVHPITDSPKRGADGKYYAWYANADGSNPHRVELPDWNDDTSLQGKWKEFEGTYKALHDGATPPPEMKDKWLAVQSGLEAKAGKEGPAHQKFINEPDSESPTGVSTVARDAVSGAELWRRPLLQSGLLEGQHTGYTMVTDADGNTHRIPYTSTSRKVIPGGKAKAAPAGNAPAGNPPAVKPIAAAAPANASSLKKAGNDVIAYKGSDAYKMLSKEMSKAQVELNEFNSRVGAMEASADDAKAGDGAAQVAVIANYIKSIVGGQGIRVTQTEWNQATMSAPWLQRLGAHFTDDGFFAYSSTPISKEQVDSMIKATKIKTEAQNQKLKDIKGQIKAQKTSDTGQEEAPKEKKKNKDPLGIM